MNKTYKSIYNERTGTFVAVAENVKAKGKRASSRVRAAGGVAALLASGSLLMSVALADVVVSNDDNQVEFTNGVGTIVAADGLTLNAGLNATGNVSVDGDISTTGS